MKSPYAFDPLSTRVRMLGLLVNHGEISGADMLYLDSSIPRGSIYTTLNRMKKQGFVTSRVIRKARTSGPPNRVYRITELGTVYQRITAKYIDELAMAISALSGKG